VGGGVGVVGVVGGGGGGGGGGWGGGLVGSQKKSTALKEHDSFGWAGNSRMGNWTTEGGADRSKGEVKSCSPESSWSWASRNRKSGDKEDADLTGSC